MKVTYELLKVRKACSESALRFQKMYPDGLDISDLWSEDESAVDALWKKILAEFGPDVGWAISEGLLPAKIRANLSRADLSGANLSEAILNGAILNGADLGGAYLRRADLSRAYLSRADLSRADLSRADLRGTILNGADLSGADLSGADLNGAIWDCYTIWPDGFEPSDTKEEKQCH